jgi:predicted ribonuclease YlaK
LRPLAKQYLSELIMSADRRRSHTRAGTNESFTGGSIRSLPPRPQALIGRHKAMQSVHDLMLRDRVRLVTITGPPGVGKTRLAIEAASRVAAEFDDGAAFIDLAPVRDPTLVLDSHR